MSEETATNPVDGEDNAAATLPDTQEVDNENQPELDEDGNPIEPEDEEVELGGLKLKVPKDHAKLVRDGVLMQADYTKKTQELAEQRAAVNAERQALHQTSQAELDTYAFAKSLEGQLAQYEQIDWDRWHAEDPFAASAATSKYQVLQRQYQQATGHLANLRGQRQSMAQQDTAKRIEQGRTALATDIPGWSEELKAKLIGFAAGYGFSRQELDDLEADPRVAKVLHAAFTGSQATATQKKVQNTLAAQAVQPAAKAASSSAPPAGLNDRLGTDEWMRRRNAQTRKRA